MLGNRKNRLFGTLFSLVLTLATVAEATTRRVDDDSTATTPDGLTWANAYSDLQEAINDSMAGDTIWLAQGEYLPTGGTPSRASTIQLKNGVIVRGGYNGLEFPDDEDTRVLDASLTVISGDLADNDENTGGVSNEGAYTTCAIAINCVVQRNQTMMRLTGKARRALTMRFSEL